MIHITSLDDGLELFKALGSDIRIQILKILLENNQMSMNQIANELNISNGALTGHIKKLEECGLISASNDSSGHGNQKLCSLIQDRILVEIEKPIDLSNVYNTSIKVGQFSSHNICPTCGLATSSFVIGELDDVRYFDHPDHFNADIMWFTKGYVEYVIPNLITRNQKITLVGTWTSHGDYGDVRGMFTPEWWPQNWNQYGLLKLLVINHKGTFIDGLKISDITTSELKLDYTSTIRFRIAVDEDSAHVGGLTIFGKSFGNYDQDIVVSINYAPLDTEKNTK